MKILESRLWRGLAIFTAVVGLIIAIFGFITKCEAGEITWHQVNEVTIAWDAVTKLVNGSDIPEGDLARYKVFVAEPGKKEEKFDMGETEFLEFTLGLPKEGRFFAGVQALRYRVINEVLTFISGSTIAWSDTDEDTNNNPFGIVFYFKPAGPLNLRKEKVL